MNVNRVLLRGHEMVVNVDGFEIVSFQMKYTLLELGFAVYLDDECRKQSGYGECRDRHVEMIPGDVGRGRVDPGHSGLVTSDPVLFALAYGHWWHVNGVAMAEPIKIPTRRQALRVQRGR